VVDRLRSIIVCDHPIHPTAQAIIEECRASAAERVRLEVRNSMTWTAGGNRMGVPTYSAVAYVADDSDFSVPAAVTRFRSRPCWSRLRMEVVSDKELHLFFGGWRLMVVLDDDEYVVSEGQETAAAFPNYAHADEVARCRRMVSIYSKDPGPNMDHFNDYLLLVEELVDAFRGFYALDEASENWFDEGRA
jgi:hypothetical protein